MTPKKGRLRPVKRLITRGGKTFVATYYVSDEDVASIDFDVPIMDTDFVEVKTVKGIEENDLTTGDYVTVRGVKGEVSGTIRGIGSSLYKGERYYYMELITSEGIKTIASQKLYILSLTKRYKDSSEKSEETFKETPFTLEDMVRITSLGGSSDVQLYRDKSGYKYAVKSETSLGGLGQLELEVTADELYREMGIDTPISSIIEGKKVSEYIEGRTLGAHGITDSIRKELWKGFMMDVLLRNQDVIGDAQDNILIGKDEKVYRIDNGSSFMFRARGGDKPWTKDNVVQDFVDIMNPDYAAGRIFIGIPLEEVNRQITDIVVHLDDLHNIMGDNLFETFQARCTKLSTHVKGLIRDKIKVKKSEDYDKGKFSSKITSDYFKDWGKFQIEGNPELKEAIETQILKQEKSSIGQYETYARDEGMSVEDFKSMMQRDIEKMVQESEFFIVAHLDNGFDGILKDGRFKTLFETRSGSGCCSTDIRARTEKVRFGYPDDDGFKPESRPISGYFVNNRNGVMNDQGTIPPPNLVDNYGDIIFKVKKDVAWHKATITSKDSLSKYTDFVATPAAKPHFTSVEPRDYRTLRKCAENGLRSGFAGYYVEAQYHNQLHIEDIESIHIPKSYDEDKLTNFINMVADFKADTGNKHLKVVVF